jgi:hypothetical protein
LATITQQLASKCECVTYTNDSLLTTRLASAKISDAEIHQSPVEYLIVTDSQEVKLIDHTSFERFNNKTRNTETPGEADETCQPSCSTL